MRPHDRTLCKRKCLGELARNLLKRIKVICPVQSHLKKYFRSRLTQISFRSLAVSSYRGAYRDRHGRGAGCGGRGSVRRCQGMAGRVDTARELTNGTLTTTLFADGKAVWS